VRTMPDHYLLHDIDGSTYFCRKCGKALQQIVDDRLSCISGENVVAISHILSARRLNALCFGATAPRQSAASAWHKFMVLGGDDAG